MPEPVLTESTFVLDTSKEVFDPAHRRQFTREPDDHTDVPHTVSLRHETWVDFGEPDAITVTVRPGDLLNDRTSSDGFTLRNGGDEMFDENRAEES